MTDRLTILQGDALERLRELPDGCVQMCVTSPPYFGLRNYQGGGNEIGQEKTPDLYVARLVELFGELRRVLKDDATFWLNLGDGYANDDKWGGATGGKHVTELHGNGAGKRERRNTGIPRKNLIGIPWAVAFALRADGWYLRSEITWLKRSSMPESVTDRPSSATEKIFLLAKQANYFYDAAAVRQPASESYATDRRWVTGSRPENEKNGYELALAQNPKRVHKLFDKQVGRGRRHEGFTERWDSMSVEEKQAVGSNLRNYWLLGPEPCREAHFATFPSEVPRRCILAGSRVGDTVIDPFFGSGTTGLVALELGRKCIGIDLNSEYIEIAQRRCNVTPGLAL